MISVIIPTMWKAPHIERMVPLLDQHPLIGEIIIIDNDITKTKTDLIEKTKKISYHPFTENIFVNPAWNYGVKNSKYDKLFILNDDCLINLNPLQTIYDFISPKVGIIGYSALSYCTYDINSFETFLNSRFGDDIVIEPIDSEQYVSTSGMPHHMYGSAMFMHKANYRMIPEEFKVYYGDVFLFISNLKNNILNYAIDDGLVLAQQMTTVQTIPREITDREADIVRMKFEEYGLKGFVYQKRTDFS